MTSIARALIDPPPLRTTAAWPQYRELLPLPIGYGEVALQPLQYDSRGLRWFVLDQGATLIAAARNGAPYQAVELVNEADTTGRVVSILDIDNPLRDDETLVVQVLAEGHPTTGAAMTNPATVLWDLLANKAAKSEISEGDFSAFASACAVAGIELAGVVTGTESSLQSVIDSIMASVGGMFSAAMPGYARLYPVDDLSAEPVVGYYTGGGAGGAGLDSQAYNATYQRGNVYTKLQINYDYDWSSSGENYRQSVLLQADDQAVEQYGERLYTHNAPWLHAGGLADALGERLLAYLSRPLWSLSFQPNVSELARVDSLAIGQAVDLRQGLSPLSGPHIIQGKTNQPENGRVTLTIEGNTGRAPAVEIIQRGQAVGPAEPEFFSTTDSDVLVITTVPGAAVMLGNTTVVADSSGAATFTGIAAGIYSLTITVAGYDTYTTDSYQVL